eukprot:6206239-Pleurochrysis_carterae.AAC.3
MHALEHLCQRASGHFLGYVATCLPGPQQLLFGHIASDRVHTDRAAHPTPLSGPTLPDELCKQCKCMVVVPDTPPPGGWVHERHALHGRHEVRKPLECRGRPSHHRRLHYPRPHRNAQSRHVRRCPCRGTLSAPVVELRTIERPPPGPWLPPWLRWSRGSLALPALPVPPLHWPPVARASTRVALPPRAAR